MLEVNINPAKLADFADVLRDEAREKANDRAERWRDSERAYRDRRRRQATAEWYAYHLAQAERLERTAGELAAAHRARAEALLAEGSPTA